MKLLHIILLAFLGLIGSAFAQIEAGTSVQITIQGVPAEEKGKIDSLYPVSESGTVNLPFVGVIKAAGKKPENLAITIQNAYRAAEIYKSPTIQVVSTAAGGSVQSQLVHVGGNVRRTGPVNYQKNLTIYQAVQAASGANEFGSLKRVKLYRGGKTETFDLTNPQFKRVPLQPNDTLEVPAKNWRGG